MRTRSVVDVMQGSTQSQSKLKDDIRQQVRDAVQAAKDAADEVKEARLDIQSGNAQDIGLAVQQSLKDAKEEGRSAVVVTSTGANGAFTISMAPRTGDQGPFDGLIPREAVDIVSILGITLVCCVVGLPIARAFGRWMDRRGSQPKSSPDVSARLQGIEQAVEAVAVEVERISEGQRFTTRLLNERTHEPAREFVAADREAVPVASAPPNARRG